MRQQDRTVQEAVTSLGAAEVLERARQFFVRRNGVYTAFPEQQSERHLTLRGQGGEEIAIGVSSADRGTRVTASTYMFDQQVARFLAELPSAPGGTAA